MLQNDMNLYKAAGAEDKIFLVSSGTSSQLNTYLKSLIRNYAGVPWEQKPLSRRSSDHISWIWLGYHASFPFEDPSNFNRKIHTAHDTLEGASFTQSSAFAKLSLSYVTHFAGIHK